MIRLFHRYFGAGRGAIDGVSGASIYVDSVGGNDANSGLTSLLPKQTLAGARAIATGALDVFYLKKGSTWRETLNLVLLTRPTVTTYGSGDAPIIDGSNVSTGWTVVSGNVYEKSITHDGSGSGRLTVYEDGVLMTRVADVAACEAAPGSFVKVLGSAGSPVSVRIHATGGGDPDGNGKTYEVSVRTNGIYAADGAVVSGVQTQKAISNNGALDLVDAAGCYISQCLSAFGTKHHIGIGSGEIVDSISIYGDAIITEEPSNNPFIAYLDDGTGEEIVMERCGVIDTPSGTAFESHGNSNPLDHFTIRQSWMVNNVVGSAYVGESDVNEGNYFKNCLNLPFNIGTVTNLQSLMNSASNATTLGDYGDLSVTDSVMYCAERQNVGNFNELLRLDGTGDAVIEQSAFAGFTHQSAWMNNGAAGSLTCNRTIFFGGVLPFWLPSGSTYVGNYNVFYNTSIYDANQRFVAYTQDGGGILTTLAAWQSATGQDSQSVYVAPADQTASNANAFWLGVSSGDNNGPVDGDWRINPNARVYSSADVAYIGTFPNGTLITTAGPQTHWDWNLRESVSGAPTAWPNVPDSLAEAKTYIADPVAWDFYLIWILAAGVWNNLGVWDASSIWFG